MEKKNDTEIVDTVMSTLRKIYGADTPDPIASLVGRWWGNPYTHGSYSYYAVGSTPKDRYGVVLLVFSHTEGGGAVARPG